jgi:adenylate kinase family enzyme
LLTGGPGAGASTTGQRLAATLGLQWLDSDTYFHKPTDPPYREQYAQEERARLLHEAFRGADSWILSGSIAAWEIHDVAFSHAILLHPGPAIRLARLRGRERERFGARIDAGGEMHEDHREFLEWAASWESGELAGRSLPRERAFIARHCARSLEILGEPSPEALEQIILSFLGPDYGRTMRF